MVESAPHEYKERVGSCAECGNSPVRHFEHYVANTLAVWSARAPAKNRFFAPLHRAASYCADVCESVLMRALSLMPFARFSRDIPGAATYRSQVVWEEAARRGIPMEQLVLFGRGTEVYRARIGAGWTYFQSIPVPRHLSARSAEWMDDKYMLKLALASAGIPVPRALSTHALRDALSAPDTLGPRLAIKPRNGSRGRHTSVDVRSEDEIREAFESAQRLCRYVAVEEYLPGSVCRGTVIGGTLVGFFQAHPPTVVGDGNKTIRELIIAANASKHERVQNIALTAEHERFLARRGYTLDSVPIPGERVALTHRTGRLFGGETRELLGAEHPKLRAYLEKAAAILHTPLVGFDMVIENPEEDPDGQRWGIIEANGLPYIDLHYLPLHGTPSQTASAVWDLWGTPVHTGE
jgi:cyanophycin synthetase